jgi:hypothetical protein
MESYWLYRNRGEKENNQAEIKTAIRMHQYAGEFYREARERMGLTDFQASSAATFDKTSGRK